VGCIGTAPQTVDDFIGVINHCATQYGGAHWQTTALLGLAAAALIGLALALALIGLKEMRRG
jgi:hypothetical protein